MKIFLLSLLLIQNAIATPKKEAVFIVLGANGIIDQEVPEYATDLAKQGYTINIHSFDDSYTNDPSVAKKISMNSCYNQKKIEKGLNNDNLSHINYTVYDNIVKDFVMVQRKIDKNVVNLFRYAVNVTKNSRTEKYIKNIVDKAIAEKNKLVFIDTTNCSGIQKITKDAFKKYKKNAVFLQSVFGFTQIINDDFISKLHDQKCQTNGKYLSVFKVENLYLELFDNIKNINDLVAKNNTFSDMSDNDKQIFINKIKDMKNKDRRFNSIQTANCINEALQESKLTQINQEVIDEYYKQNN